MEDIINDLNGFLSDLSVFYRKLQNYHWNVYGKDFLELPKLVNDQDYKNKKFYIIDDIYATGNTMKAIQEGIEKLGGEVIGEGVVMNIVELNDNKELFSLIEVNEE